MSDAIKITLAELASALSGQTMAANEEHTFLVSRDLLLTLATEDSGRIGLYCTLYRAEIAIAAEIQEEILVANYGCAGTNGATLGTYPQDNTVMMTQIIPCADCIPENRLLEIGLAFINTCIIWHDRLKNPRPVSPKVSNQSLYHGFLKI